MNKQDEPPSLLLISWNRLSYLRKTVEQLFDSSSDFRVYLWDNDSSAETLDFLAEIKDDRVTQRHLNHRNANQDEPVRWFLEKTPNGFVGKIDDDILLPSGWTDEISKVLSSSERFGMLGCWIFMPDDYDEAVAKQNVISEGEHQVFAMTAIAGHSFLARRDLMRRFLYSKGWGGSGIPIDRGLMTLKGFISGHPIPMIMAHNMDDPRSESCVMHKASGRDEMSALTARVQGIRSIEEYGTWIRADALRRQSIPFRRQLRELELRYLEATVLGRVHKKLSNWLLHALGFSAQRKHENQ